MASPGGAKNTAPSDGLRSSSELIWPQLLRDSDEEGAPFLLPSVATAMGLVLLLED